MKKGSLSIETIIVIILALLVLVIIAVSFSGGMKELFDRIRGVTPTEITLDDAIKNCNDVCNKATNSQAFCGQSYIVQNVGPKACKDLISCSKYTC